MRTHLVALLSLVMATAVQAKNPIRQSFFNTYTNAIGSKLDNLPSKPGHCGLCHYDFNGGGARNPYGAAIESQSGLNTEAGRTNAIKTVSGVDQDSDGYFSITEITDLNYGNTPTFPGLSTGNSNRVANVPIGEIANYLSPSTATDATRPTVTVLFPSNYAILTANRVTNITWTAGDNVGVTAIQIHESLDNGASYSPIALGLANSGTYAWTPANRPVTSNALIRITAVDAAGNSSNDVSNIAFTIISPPGGLVPTTLRDFDMPGTQPFQGGSEFATPQSCATCHGDYSPAVEPYRNWQGSMMAHAGRDPLFEANMAIANQDAPDSGDLCLRCHKSNGWLQGRSVPTDGSRMIQDDRHGVSCELCHRMVDPVFKPGVNPAVDTNILAALTFPGTNYGNGMYVIDPTSTTRGPFTNAAAPHAFVASSFHRSSAFCGTCHDVSNPAFTKDANGVYQPNSLNATAGVYSAHGLAPVERTYSEWFYSAYNSSNGVYAPKFAGNKAGGTVSTCQDCHMRDVTGYGCNTNLNAGVPLRTDLPLHDMTGGSTWIPSLLTNLYPDEVSAPAIAAGIVRANYMLQNAATMSASFSNGFLQVTVTNQTGHKLPTGYPEGRRVWVNVKFFDHTMNLIGESGAYNQNTGVLTHDTEAKIYAVHPGIDANITNIVGLAAGPSLHFVLNNKIYEDNRIPPRGFSNATFAAFGGAPVGHSYADGQHWDRTPYTVPLGTARAEVRLFYQSTSKEFIEFLRDKNTTNTKGQEMYDLWNNNGKCPPDLMAQATWEPAAPVFAGLKTATPGVESAILAWDAASSACAVTYQVFQSTASGGQNFGAPLLTTNALSTVIAPLDPGTTNALTYYFVVRATDSCGGIDNNTVERSVQPALDPAKDQDSDGMPNAYEQTHGLNPFNAADAALDPDGDGFTNLQESIAGTSPNSNGQRPAIEQLTADTDGIHIRFATVTGRMYQVKWRASLTTGEWQNLGSAVAGDGTVKEVLDTPSPATSARFYKVQITKP